MKIVLVELHGPHQQERNERAFDQEAVRIGRDPAACDIVFDQVEWPMVSRRHGELRQAGNRCLLVDSGAKFGTLLNGRRITEPTPVEVGARIQFGASGPVLRIVRIEFEGHAAAPPPQNQANIGGAANEVSSWDTLRDIDGSPVQPAPARSTSIDAREPVGTNQIGQQKPAPPMSAPLASTPLSPASPPSANAPQSRHTAAKPGSGEFAAIEFVGGGSNTSTLGSTHGQKRTPLTGDRVLLGRDPSSAITIDAASAIVSRRHAELRREAGGQWMLADLGSFNGTLLNEQRITEPTPLYHNDAIQLGAGGPVLRFIEPQNPPPPERARAAQNLVPPTAPSPEIKPSAAPGNASPARQAAIQQPAAPGGGALQFQHTMVAGSGTASLRPGAQTAQPTLTMHRLFDGNGQLSIGRAPDNEIRLDGLQISNHHARFIREQTAVVVEDAGSTNGVYINGERITGRRPVQPQDVVQIGPFLLQVTPQPQGIAVFDTRSKTRIDAIDITKEVSNRSGGGKIKLLDDVDLTIMPNEFVGLLGPSGAGKSTLMDALNGMRPASSGRVFINNLDFYQHLDSLKQSIGYVPQDDIIHRELTVYRTLYYVARLRLSRDASKAEIDQIINEVMDVTGLAERRDVPVAQLSGGQRKRVSIAVELITKPSVIFLDEPTSGLDPATEEKIMRLFRQIAESGRTVILTTHAMENVRLFDKIVVMMRGKLVFYGAPAEALAQVGATSFKDLYDKLEEPIEQRLKQHQPPPANASAAQKREWKKLREQTADAVAEEWRQRFQQSEIYRRNIYEPLSALSREPAPQAIARRRSSVSERIRQWATLTRRYFEVLGRDKLNLLILFGQAPIIALMTYLVVGSNAPRDFPYFMLALIAVWFGTSVAAREIIKEAAVYKRERMVNLGLLPYVGSKLFVLSLIVGIQCLFLFVPLKLLHVVGLMNLPGYLLGIPQLIVMILTAMVGVALGLFVSAVVKTSEMATSLVPLILIPQILFSGLVGVPEMPSKLIGLTMPATWSFDEMKRLSGLDTLRPEGSDPDGSNQGRGLYDQIEHENDELITDARRRIREYREDANEEFSEYERRMRSGQRAEMPTLGDPPEIGNPRKIDEDLSNYVDFLHPWGNIVLNPLVLIIMFFVLVGATIIALRLQDIK
jgi:ABC transport system ATP-binding/permease protein